MKRFNLGYEEKQIVYATIRMSRKNCGSLAYAEKSRAAIEKAEEEFDLGDIPDEVKNHILQKIYQSIAYMQPWELLGETYCSRGMFYQYRKQFCYLVAVKMGIAKKERERKRR